LNALKEDIYFSRRDTELLEKLKAQFTKDRRRKTKAPLPKMPGRIRNLYVPGDSSSIDVMIVAAFGWTRENWKGW
jgi:hypothetical protein